MLPEQKAISPKSLIDKRSEMISDINRIIEDQGGIILLIVTIINIKEIGFRGVPIGNQ